MNRGLFSALISFCCLLVLSTCALDDFILKEWREKAVKEEKNRIPVLGVQLDRDILTIDTGDEPVKLNATVFPENATNKAVTWSSGNPAVATVNSDGLVTPVTAGTATITVSSQDGGKKDYCEVTVTNSSGITGMAVTPVITSQPQGLFSLSVNQSYLL